MAEDLRLVVGTAGHIDHGKSRLVLALTGTDPDRLPEEKARGMTIDLGFAHVALEGCAIWFVDVPGHERFIHNMLAGASGVDVALLVIAADDSVMPQTREHAEVLSLLGVDRCIAALTKMDLVDDEWAEQVEEEVRDMLADYGIEPVGFVRTSAETGRGLDELRSLLVKLAREQSQRHEISRWFRLPIDRAFVVAGRGTVVTGSVAHGSVTREDELELWPGPKVVRVRDLQTHYDERESAAGRMRLAINLAGVSQDETGRGYTLATPGYLEPARYLDVWIAWLRMPGKTRKQTLRLRLHLATSEVLTELKLLEKPTEDGVREQFGQLKVAESVVASWGERFILRDESGSRTLGGGCILRPVARLWTAKRPAQRGGLQTLLDGAPPARLEEAIRAAEWRPLDEQRLAVRAGLEDKDTVTAACRRLMGAGIIRALEAASIRLYVHNSHLKALGDDLTRRLKQYMHDNPRQPGLPRSQWPGWMPGACPARFRPVLAEWYLKTELVMLVHDHIVPAGEKQSMSSADQALLDQLLAEYDEGAFQPPDMKTFRCRTPKNEKRVRELIELAVARGQLVRVADGLWLHARRWEELIDRVVAAVHEKGGLTVSDIRTLLNSSRKYVVPIVERLDAAGITRRVGDRRTLGPKAS
ncbi:MAG: selenocysteine-specific translation elongation factor [Phycisphaerae bacterium]|nr:selenocysteine-specific translation elongation factor [Phycisphaerae bacterium]